MKKNIRLVVPVLGVMFLLLLSACGNTDSKVKKNSEEGKTLKIVTTFYPMYDFTKNIVQDNAEISMLIPAGTESHGFEPSAKVVASIQDADVFIYNSDEMETWVPSTLEAIDTTKVTVINASEGIEFIEKTKIEEHAEEGHEHAEEGHEHAEEGHEHAIDPHVWLNPVLAQAEVKNIQMGLAKADKENAALYQKNAEKYNQELEELDQEFKAAFENAENRTFVTQHAAFAYLAKQYNLTQVSISGLSSETEPSPAKLAELSNYAKKNNVRYIYFENNASSKIAETLAAEADIELAVLDPIEGVSQKEQDAGVDYIQVMKNNLESLKKSIQ
ncbi:zinc transport system substrate-binding protein [Carnobacterium iners]|uniref:Zinc transport system substrate-binding protein n=1 Tax=Carnobacterium iners TaxID=1073423 RepID=A0A1X7MSD1_9LACT|nr:metal ABC transporter substrate-binding protein [Carnobacterium iners]SEL13405.1 zinc transport system substrate-binding protein [Carnobacterium iners]SMH27037.1 zinc transport system substrate-binding protein [Carnobacterium iners]